MKRNYVFSAAAVLLLYMYASCRKLDAYFSDPEQCRIVKINELFDGIQPWHRTVFYNEWGNPVKVEYNEDEQGTGNPTFVFVYDDKQRLIAYEGFNSHHLT